MIVLFRGLTAHRVNLLMNDYAAGLPSPLAFLGLAAAMAPDLGVPRWSIGVLPVLHRVHVYEGRTRPENQPKSGRFEPTEIPEDLLGSVEFSLFLDLPEDLDPSVIDMAFDGRKLGGGPILPMPGRSSRDRLVAGLEGRGRDLLRAPRGYAFVPTWRPERQVLSAGGAADLRALADAVHPASRGRGFGRPVVAAVGYRMIETPDQTLGRRQTRTEAVPHVFAEPLAGVAELVSVRSPEITGRDASGFRDLFWAWRTEPGLVLTHAGQSGKILPLVA